MVGLLYAQLISEVSSRVRVIALSHLFGSATDDKLSATVASLRAYVDKVVGTLDDLYIVLDDEDGVAARDERVERLHQALDVVEVEACGGLVEDEHGGLGLFEAEVVGEFDALVLTAREGRRALPQLYIAEAHIL